MLLLIDADVIVFRAGFAAEKNCWFLSVGGKEPEQFVYKKEATERLDELLPGIHSRVEGEDYQLWSERYLEPVENALHNAKSIVERCRDQLDATDFDVKLVLSGGDNFRYAVAKTRPYKGNRDKAHRPTHEKAIREYLASKWDTIVAKDEEADDVLGYTQCTMPEDSIICTIDKDLNMIPGWKYDFVKEEKYHVTDDEAMGNFYRQLVTGDATDNIVGIPRAGVARANKILSDRTLDEQWLSVVAEYMAKGGENWEAYLREQGQLLWIRRVPEEMWEPDLEGYAGAMEESTEVSLYE
jgi:hypothetical protein